MEFDKAIDTIPEFIFFLGNKSIRAMADSSTEGFAPEWLEVAPPNPPAMHV